MRLVNHDTHAPEYRFEQRCDAKEQRLVEAFRDDLRAALAGQTQQLAITWAGLLLILTALGFAAGRMP